MSKYTKYYLHEYCLEKEDKQLLLDVFRKRENVKSIKCNKILNVKKYERYLKVYSNEHKEELEEIRNIRLGTVEYWELLSSKCQTIINDYFYLKYKRDYNFEFKYLFENEYSGEYGYIEKKLQRISEFARKYDLDVFNEDDSLKVEYLSDVFYSNRIINEKKVILEVIVYAITEKDYKLIDLDDNDNVILSSFAYEKYILKKEVVPLITSEKIRKSIIQTENQFKNICYTNCDLFEYFVTLTFASIDEKEKHLMLNAERRIDDEEVIFEYVVDPTNYDCCVKTMTYFLNKMKKYLKRKGIEFYYLGVPEYQKNGNIHYHFLMSKIPDDFLYKNPDWADRDYNTNKKLYSRGIKLWKYGLSNVSIINDKLRCSTYISKYMTKSLKEIDSTVYYERLNKKRFYRSNNLELPEVYYGNIDEEELDYISCYETFGTNLYDGTLISIKQYQLENI